MILCAVVFVCACVCVYLYVSFVFPSACLSLLVCSVVCLFVRFSVRFSVCLSVCLSACLSACLSVCVSACVSRSNLHYPTFKAYLCTIPLLLFSSLNPVAFECLHSIGRRDRDYDPPRGRRGCRHGQSGSFIPFRRCSVFL